MTVTRRHLIVTVFALAALTALPALAGTDEDAVARNLQAFRSAQVAANAADLKALSAARAPAASAPSSAKTKGDAEPLHTYRGQLP